MDQESFRKLLATKPAPSGNSTPVLSRGSLLATKSKSKTENGPKPEFKPRKVKKSTSSRYRDRASERRVGTGNDFAEVEALLEDFEKRNAEEDREKVEEQRRYLGGDSEHSILVKGLDYSLLEQNRARLAAATSAEDDESLEQAFVEAKVPQKRTREDIVRDLKEKRQKVKSSSPVNAPEEKEEKDRALEEAKKAGKFRPIGFKPIGEANEEKKKKKKKDNEGEKEAARKQKKRKTGQAGASATSSKEIADAPKESGSSTNANATLDAASDAAGPSGSQAPGHDHQPETKTEPEPIDEGFDIFADAGEYQGIDLGEDEEDEAEEEEAEEEDGARGVEPGPTYLTSTEGPSDVSQPVRANWFGTLSEERETKPPSPPPVPAEPSKNLQGEAQEEEEETVSRLVPLSGSAMPSIKEFLAMEEAAEKAAKKKARREKKKGKKTAGDNDSE